MTFHPIFVSHRKNTFKIFVNARITNSLVDSVACLSVCHKKSNDVGLNSGPLQSMIVFIILNVIFLVNLFARLFVSFLLFFTIL